MRSRTRLPTLTLQVGIGRSIDLSQFARSPIYGFIALTGRSIPEAEAAPVFFIHVLGGRGIPKRNRGDLGQ
jgi:hypothetical protein